MLLLNLKNLSSIEIKEPELLEDVVFKNNIFTKKIILTNGMIEFFNITNPMDINNLKNDFIIDGEKLYNKPFITFKELDGKTTTINFKTVKEFNKFIDNKLKPYYDIFLIF